MSTVAFLQQLQDLGIVISQKDGRLLVKGNKAALTAQIKNQLSSAKAAIIELFAELKLSSSEQLAPATQSQQRVWFIDRMEGNKATYNIAGNVTFRGVLNIDVLYYCFKTVIERQAGLRTTFFFDGTKACQVIHPVAMAIRDFDMPVVDLTDLSPAQQAQQVKLLVKEEAAKPFDLTTDLMLRVKLLRLADDEVVLLNTLHHIAADGWSMGVLAKEINTLYEAYIQGKTNPLPALAMQYSQYAQWEHRQISQGKFDGQLDYWQNQLGGLPLVHNLPLDKPRPLEQSFKGKTHHSHINKRLLKTFEKRCGDSDATLFIGLNAVFSLLLGRYSAEQDIVIGTSNANRAHPDFAPLIGFFLNTLVLRTDLSQADDFEQLLKQSREVVLGAFEHQQVPFEALIKSLDVPQTQSHSPLFQVMLILQNNTPATASLPGLTATPGHSGRSVSKFDLTLYASEDQNGLNLSWEYSTDLFEPATIECLAASFAQFLSGVVADFNAPLNRLPLLSAREKDEYLIESFANQQEYPQDQCIHYLFEQQAEVRPDAIAVVAGSEQLSYRQLNSQANQLAHYLIEQGVEPDSLVGLCVDRSPQMIIAILAILKAGGAYVPLDPAYPKSRLQHMVADSGIQLLLTQSSVKDRVQDGTVNRLLLNDCDLSGFANTNPQVDGLTSAHLAYVIYTSGSTGLPKGVMVTHRNVQSYCRGASAGYRMSSDDRVLQFSALAFDIFVEEAFLSLSYGGALVLRDEDMLSGGRHFWSFINKHQVSVISLPTAYWHQLCADLDSQMMASVTSLRLVILGGEAMSLTMLARWRAAVCQQIRVLNTYGPTETTVIATLYDTAELEENPHHLPIGMPVANTQCLVLDDNLNICPMGVHGQLYIGGESLARGYLNRPDLTEQQFIANPFGEGRLYKTGDMVRCLPDGNLVFIGRCDNQVKIRGFRIELGEIERQLSQLPQVKSALVVVNQDDPQQKRLVAYVVGTTDVAATQLREHLQTSLPDYMVPSFFVMLDELPLTANGKVDVKALPAPDAGALSPQYVAPATAVERKLAVIWAQLLKLDVDKVSATANFFESGGHSLLSVRLVGEIRAEFGAELAIKDIFDAARLSKMASLIEHLAGENSGKAQRAPIVALARINELLPCSFAQQRLWFIDQMDGGSVQYNMPGVLRFKGAFDAHIVEQAFIRIIERHEPLRTVFVDTPEGVRQQIKQVFDFQLTLMDFRGLAGDAQQQAVEKAVQADANRVFNLAQELMLRCSVIRLSADEGVLLFNIHHIATDGWSMGRLVKEFYLQYQAISQDQPNPLPPLPIQYADYAQWQRNWLQGDVLTEQLQYWEKQLADIPQVHSLPLDRARPKEQGFNGAVATFEVASQTLEGLKQLALSQNATLFMVLQGAFALLLSRHSSCYEHSHDIVIGVPVANRMQKALEDIIGFFVNTLVLRTDCSQNPTFIDFLARVKTVNLDAQAHQDVPFELLVEHLKPQRSMAHSPLFQILFSMNTNETTALELDDVNLVPVVPGNEQLVSKFELALNAVQGTGTLALRFEYNCDLFDRKTIGRLGEHLLRLLNSIVAQPQMPIGTLSLLGEDEKRYLTHQLNATRADYPHQVGLHQLFERQVELFPDNIAVACGGLQLDYRTLNQQANRLAGYLMAQGVVQETLVGLCVKPSVDSMVAILAILKAGGAYVPLDPNYPQSRLDYMIKDSGVTLLLCQSGASLVVNNQLTQVVVLNEPQLQLADYPSTNPSCEVNTDSKNTADSLAYMIYTSGSTGQPKGVLVEHRSVVNMLSDMQRRAEQQHQYRSMLWTSLSFDVSVYEIFDALLFGGTLLVPDQSVRLDAGLLFNWMKDSNINHAYLPPFFLKDFESWVQQGNIPALNKLLVGVEPISERLLNNLCASIDGLRIVNGYGPSEATICSTLYNLDQAQSLENDRNTPIGRPLQNNSHYVLSQDLQLQPLGATGELYIGGDGLARGYHNQPQMTAQRFIDNPFSDDPNSRLYKTGDLVRYLPDGNLMFVGRADEQVKVRGFRIELGEIEHQLTQHPAVKAAVVLALEHPFDGHKYLVAYVVINGCDGSDDISEMLTKALQTRLPEYMVPACFVPIETLPLTANGKIDKKALPAPDALALTAYVAPVTETEIVLVGICAELLKIDENALSVTAHFFESGGHSLLSVRLVAQLRARLGVELVVRDVFNLPQLRQLAAFIDDHDSASARPEIVAVARDIDDNGNSRMATSYAQQRLWFIDQLEGGSPQYNMPVALRFDGMLDAVIVEQAFARIIERHEPLRTVFVADEAGSDSALQVIRDDVEFKLSIIDLTGLDSEAQAQAVQQAARDDAAKTFDLANDLMLRSTFIRLSAEHKGGQGVLLFNMHHIASDGWSMGLLVNEFWSQYQAIAAGEANPFAPLPIQYADYANWQRKWLASETMESQWQYWDQQLADLPLVHELPLDRPRLKVQGFKGERVSCTVEQSLLDELKQLALSQNATLFMLLQGVFALLLSRHAHSTDIVMGVPMANRLQKELEEIIGFFVNTLVLRTDCSQNPTFVDYLARVKQLNLDAQSNQDVPFEHLVERLNPQRSTAYAPLCQILFTMFSNDNPALELDDVTLSPHHGDEQALSAKFELTLNAQETEQGLGLHFEYNTDIFDADSIESLACHMIGLLQSIVANPQRRIDELPMLSEQERHQLVHELNDTLVEYDNTQFIHTLFERQVEATPDTTALVFENRQLSYRQLNQKANQLARHLRAQGVQPDTLVGLCVERSIEMMIGIFAILKAGGAYVPIDPNYPSGRLQYLVADSDIKLVLSQKALSANLNSCFKGCVDVFAMDDEAAWQALNGYSLSNLPLPDNYTVNNLAYVIYTSGSTGQPKGVLVEHHSVVNRLVWGQSEYQLQPDDVVLQKTPYSFDVSVYEYIWPLMVGAKLVIAKPLGHMEPQYLLDTIVSHGITYIHFVPSMLRLIVAEKRWALCTSLRYVFCSGEALPADLVQLHYQTNPAAMHNLYGPTEASIEVSYWPCPADDGLNNVPIGKPIQNVGLYVLNQSLQLQPFGAVGELHIGGNCLARGYQNLAELTAKTFIDNPYGQGRLYKTGDLVRYLPDGNIDYIGRIDGQVKIRGLRIEPGEIEYQLSQLTQVQDNVVMVREDVPGHQQLVAYVVSSLEDSELTGTLRKALQRALPVHMVPSVYIGVATMPLTASGKVDRKALPVPDGALLAGDHVTPQTEAEKTLVGIWSDLLNIDPDTLSATANFFGSGGHSLLSVRLVGEIRSAFGVELAIKDIFETPELSQMALLLEQRKDGLTRAPVVAQQRTFEGGQSRFPASFAQQRLWFIDKMDGTSAQYNMPEAMRFSGVFDQAIVEQAFARIIERHEPLRTVFVDSPDGALQVIRDVVAFKLTTLDLSELAAEDQQQAVLQAAHADATKAFDLSKDLPLRSTFIRLSNDEGVLLFNIHHIASDGWSMGLLVSEFGRQYNAIVAGDANPLEPLAVQYADYALWQQDLAAKGEMETQLSYWDKQLAELPQVHSLPLDRPRPAEQTFNGAAVSVSTTQDTLDGLKQLAFAQNATLFMLLQGSFALLLSRHSNTGDIAMGVPMANRLQKELEPVIGFFINTLVLRADCSGNPSFTEFLAQVKTTNLDAQANQDVPFEHLVDRLQPARSTSQTPLFQIMFSMNTNEQSHLELTDVTLSPLERTEQDEVAKFELTLNAMITEDGLALSFVYNTDLFDGKTIETLAQHFVTLLEGIVADPHCGIDQLPMLSEQEQQHLLADMNNTAVDYPQDVCIHHLFEQQAERTPDNIAVNHLQQQLSYRELNEKANQLAHYLRSQGVKPDTLVGLRAERSIPMMIGLLAILKAGGAYVPLDPNYPQSRLQYMIEDSGIKLLLDEQALGQTREDFPSTNPEPVEGQSADNLAYVIYTSGSTGKPKGVLNEHRALANLCHWHRDHYCVDSDTRATHLASIGFDAAVWEVWPYLLCGARVDMVPDGVRQDPDALIKLLCDSAITHCFMPTALLEMIGSMLHSGVPHHLKTILTGGQKLSALHPDIDKAITIVNNYGPTEAAVVSTACSLPTDLTTAPPIGKPISNVEAYVLSPHRALVPFGAVGELYIGGKSVARGYLNRGDLTEACFITNPFGEGRLYKTGDLVRYLPDGNLAFVGRIDDQVKIRGFRIELAEIEYQLAQLPQVGAAVVLVHQEQLVAYVTAQSIDGLRQSLQAVLPDYMVPAVFVPLDELPLTANGKVDKKALPQPDSALLMGQYVAPVTTTEHKLVAIWAGLLKITPEKLSTSANFFESGGHSLLAVRLVGQVRSQLRVELSIKAIFDAPQLSAMASIIENNAGQTGCPELGTVDRSDNRLPASFAQQRLWFIDQMEGGSSQYNMATALRFSGNFDEAIIEQAFDRIVERHEPLRTIFADSEDGVLQLIQPHTRFKLKRIDLSESDKQVLQQVVETDAAQVFDLTKDLMLRATLVRLAKDEGVLLLNIHHIASDGWSMGIVANEFARQYQAIVAGSANPFEPLTIQYGDYAQWQRNWLQGEALEQHIDYWKTTLDGAPQVHSLPLDRPRSDAKPTGGHYSSRLDAQLSGELQALSFSHEATLFMTVQAAFALHLGRWSRETDIVMGTPIAGRGDEALAPMVGLFLNNQVLRSQFGDNPDFGGLLARTRGQHLQAHDHNELPFEVLVERLNPARDLTHAPIFQVLINMNNNAVGEFNLPEITVSNLAGERAVENKYDITLYVNEVNVNGEDIIRFDWLYNAQLFDADTIAMVASEFSHLLGTIVAEPELPVLAHSWSNCKGWNAPAISTGQSSDIVTMFEQQAARQGGLTALQVDGQQLSYQALNQQANQLAHYLAEQFDIGLGARVAIATTRSFERIIAIWAVLKLGGAYVPLTGELPVRRLQGMLEDSQASLMLTDSVSAAWAGALSARQVLMDDAQVRQACLARSDENIANVEIKADTIAHILYTSGSTGRPKGVLGTHGATFNRISWMLERFPFADDEQAAHLTSMAFIRGVWELFVPMCAGVPMALLDRDVVKDSTRLLQQLQQLKVSRIVTAPSLMRAICQQDGLQPLNSLRYWFVSGEALPVDLAKQAKQVFTSTEFYNLYGSTEVLSDVLYSEVDTSLNCSYMPLGRPISQVAVNVVDGQGNPVPDGVLGELVVTGNSVVAGYDGLPELSKKAFIDTPVGRGYRTGDLVRVQADGQVGYVGRADHQLKIRGYRIELGEVEAQLAQLQWVTSQVVVAVDDGADQKKLVAYITTESKLSEVELLRLLRQQLRATLPDYMVPAVFVVLDELPLTPNGKVNRKALPAPDGLMLQGEYVAPQSDKEAKQALIWAEQLALETSQISVTANFFELGGNSILLLKLVAALSRAGINRTIKQFYEYPTIRSMTVAAKQTLQADDLPSQSLVKLNQTKGEKNLFVFHPLDGRVGCYEGLAASLADICPVIGVQAPYNYGHDWSFDSIAELASYYRTAIKRQQPNGPYYLAGWSAGGFVAQQVAHEMTKQGDEIQYLAVMDSTLMPVQRIKPMQRHECLKYAMQFALNEQQDSVSLPTGFDVMDYPEQLSVVADLLMETVMDDFADKQALIIALKFFVDYIKADRPLTPTTISGEALFLQAAKNPLASQLLDGWQNTIQSKSRVIPVNAEHKTMLQGYCFDEILAILRCDLMLVVTTVSANGGG